MMPANKPALWPLRQVMMVSAAAVILRILFWVLATDSPFLHTPVVDASFFDIWARTMNEGRVFQNLAFFKPPFYAYLLSWLYSAGLSLAAVQILQLLVGVLTALLTLAIGRLVFSGRVALTGALVCALLPILPFFEVQLLAESWTTALTLAAMLLLLMVICGRSPSVTRMLLVSGLLLGLATLGRPNLLLLAAVLVCWLWWFGRQNHLWKSSAAVVFLAGFVLAISPATLHNLKHGEFVLVSANLGANLVAGNSDTADGLSAIPVGVLWDDLQLRTRLAGHEKPGETSRMLTGEALGWMAQNPGPSFRLLGRRLLLLVNAEEARNNINPRWLAERDGVLVLHRWWPATWLMLPFAIVGLVFYRDESFRGASLLRWFLLAQVVAVLPFFVTARFRAPLLPVLALFAAAGLFHLIDGRGKIRALWPALAVLLAAMVLVNIDWLGLRHERWLARDSFNAGLIQARTYGDRQPDPVRAERYFREAVALNPDDPDFNERLGAFLLARVPSRLGVASRREKAGQIGEAAAALDRAEADLLEAQAFHRRAAEIFPRSFRSFGNLGTCHMWQGDIHSFGTRQAMAAADTSAARVEAQKALFMYQMALADYQRSLEINPNQPDLQNNANSVLQAVLRLPDLDPAIGRAQDNIQQGAARQQGRN